MRHVWWMIFGTILLAGCGGGGPELPAHGIITLDGKALDGVTVTFYSEEKAGQPDGYGRTGTDGKFVVKGFKGEDGLRAGKYKVTVNKSRLDDDWDQERGAIIDEDVKDELPPIYSQMNRSVLSYTITGDGQPIEIKLDSKRKK